MSLLQLVRCTRIPYSCVGRSKVWGILDTELSVTKQWVVQLIAHDGGWVVQSVERDITRRILACDIAKNKQTNELVYYCSKSR